MKRFIENIRVKLELLLFKKQKIFFLGIVIFSLLTWKSSYAERCWLVNCKEMVGYIYVPKYQYVFDKKNEGKHQYKNICKDIKEIFNSDVKGRIYKGLPEVGEVIFSRSSDIKIYKDTKSINENFKDFEIEKSKYLKEIEENGASKTKPFTYYSKVYLTKEELSSNDRESIEQSKSLAMQDCAKESYLMFYKDNAIGRWGGGLKTKIISYTSINDELFALIKILESGEKKDLITK